MEQPLTHVSTKYVLGPTQNRALTIRTTTTTTTATLPTLQSVAALNQHVTAAINSHKEQERG